jgi:hypothetical protein
MEKTVTTNILPFRPAEENEYVKISRNGERFWLRKLSDGMGETRYGEVANNLIEAHPYKLGETIEYKENEVLDEQRF